jgi:hypothetical protein
MVYKAPPLMEQLPRTGAGFSSDHGREKYHEFRQLLFDIVEP